MKDFIIKVNKEEGEGERGRGAEEEEEQIVYINKSCISVKWLGEIAQHKMALPD